MVRVVQGRSFHVNAGVPGEVIEGVAMKNSLEHFDSTSAAEKLEERHAPVQELGATAAPAQHW